MTNKTTNNIKTIYLHDGRIMAYNCYGAPNGIPILFFHGTPGSNQLALLADSAAKKYGFKLIAPDRPGIGDSSFQKNRELRSYPADIMELLTALNINTIGIIAISGGAPYALQCAHDIPQYIKYTAILSGWVSYGRPEVQKIPIDPGFAILNRLNRNTRFILPIIGKLTHWVVTNKTEKFMQHLYDKLPESDKLLLAQKHIYDIFLSDFKNAFKQGWRGVVAETILQFANPNFALKQVNQPTVILHGTKDNIAPYEFAEYMKQQLPNVVSYHKIEDGGHLCSISEQEYIFTQLKQIHKNVTGNN